MPAPALSLKARVLKLLSQREHSKSELARKLRALETPDGELAQVLDDFEAKGLISEERVAGSVVNAKASRMGGMRLRQELQAKGLNADLVRETIAGLKDTELQRAQTVWAKKFGVAALDANARAKQMRFLATRGFDGAVVRAVVPRAGGSDQALDDAIDDDAGY